MVVVTNTCDRETERHKAGAGHELAGGVRSGSLRVLVVDDEFLLAELICMMLEEMGMTVCGTAASADEAIALAEQHVPELVLMDIRLKGVRDGVDAASTIHRMIGSRVIFVTGSREPETMERIARVLPAETVFKPFQFDQLRDAVTRAMA